MGKKERKVRDPEHMGFKEMFGVTALATNNGVAAVFMSSMFMTFMSSREMTLRLKTM